MRKNANNSVMNRNGINSFMCLNFIKKFSQKFTLDTNLCFYSNQLNLIIYGVCFFKEQDSVPFFKLIFRISRVGE